MREVSWLSIVALALTLGYTEGCCPHCQGTSASRTSKVVAAVGSPSPAALTPRSDRSSELELSEGQ